MIRKPKKVATRLGTFGEVLYALAPKSVDVILNTAYKLFPESSAAKGREEEGRGGLHRGRGVRVPDARRALVAPGCRDVAATRRRKHWGWGYEDQQPARSELWRRREGMREHLGFGAGEVEQPVSLDQVELPAPRLTPPAALGGDLSPSDPHERASHAYGKAYRDVVRAFRGRFDNPPDVVAFPRDEEDVDARARLVRRARRGGDPVRRRHQRGRRRRSARSATSTPARSRST